MVGLYDYGPFKCFDTVVNANIYSEAQLLGVEVRFRRA